MAFSIFDRDQSAKICQHDWKECLWVSEVAKFESDLLKADEDIGGAGGVEKSSCPHYINVCEISPTFKLKLSYFKALFSAVSMDIRLLLFIKELKRREKKKRGRVCLFYVIISSRSFIIKSIGQVLLALSQEYVLCLLISRAEAWLRDCETPVP